MAGERKLLGILGGMGPLATADFYQRVIHATPATIDQEHIPVVIWADPTIPDRSTALLGKGPSPVPALVDGVRRLEAMGATFIAIPCNTAHAFLDEIRSGTQVPVLDMIEETAQRCARVVPAGSAVAILATQGTCDRGLYHRALERAGLSALVPTADDQATLVTPAIDLVKHGRLSEAAELIQTAAERVIAAGAAAVIGGCTEIPLVLRQEGLPAPVVDSTQVLAEVCVARWFPTM